MESSFDLKSNYEKNYNLFKIKRSKDINEIFYDVKLDSKSKLDNQNPINIYWLNYLEDGRKENLRWIQNNYSYGLEFQCISDNYADFKFVSFDKRLFKLKKNKDELYQVCTSINSKESILNFIFIQMDGGTFMIPKISRVELHVQDANTNEYFTEIIIP